MPASAQHILYIEDSPGEALLVKKSLNREGYDVTLVHEGQAGLDRYREADFSAVLVDLNLPDIPGLDVLHNLIEQKPLVPVVVVTGWGDEETAVKAMKLGAKDYIVKDVHGGYIELMPSVIEQVLRQHRLLLEKQRAEEIARRREAILESVAFAAKILLQTPAWNSHIMEILERLGKAAHVNRIYLAENGRRGDNGPTIKQSHEWTAEDVNYRTTSWAGQEYADIGLGEWAPLLANGHLVNDLIQNMPDSMKAIMRRYGIVSTIVVPIFAGHNWWGIIGFDCCINKRVWEPAEVDALNIAANILGAAVQRHLTEAALFQAQKLESIGLLAGGVAHDFNNLLAGILSQTSLSLLKLPPDSPARPNLTQAIQATEQATLLVQQLLGYAGKGNYQIQPISLNDLIQRNIGLLETIVRKRAKLTLDLMPGLPAVEADLSQIQQVVMNLVINAAEANEGISPGNIQINTQLFETDTAVLGIVQSPLPPGRYVCLDVIDNGSGIEPEILNQIFDPFFSTKAAGRGLGLSAALGIIQNHGGTLQVETQAGTGSHFRLLLPASNKPA